MKDQKKPLERWVHDKSNARNISNTVSIFTAVAQMPDNPGWTRYIEFDHYARLATSHDEKVDLLKNFQELFKEFDSKVVEILTYCRPHVDEMWAAKICSVLLDCDFRDVKRKFEDYEAGTKHD